MRKKRDLEKICEKLEETGFVREFGFLEENVVCERWRRDGDTLVVIADVVDGKCGLYQFVGTDGAPVEDDLKFIESLAD